MIRLLGSGDLEVFRQIRLESLRTDPLAFANTAADWEKLSDDEWVRRMTDNPVFVSFDGGEPVAIMGLFRQSPSKMAHRAWLIMVFVRPRCRGQGHAKALLHACRAYAKSIGLMQLELAVSAENHDAVGFYERMGFELVGRIPSGLLQDGRKIDELLMVHRLDA
jgi:ribosomal protein S18 acetylase RimI-like enzyme